MGPGPGALEASSARPGVLLCLRLVRQLLGACRPQTSLAKLTQKSKSDDNSIPWKLQRDLNRRNAITSLEGVQGVGSQGGRRTSEAAQGGIAGSPATQNLSRGEQHTTPTSCLSWRHSPLNPRSRIGAHGVPGPRAWPSGKHFGPRSSMRLILKMGFGGSSSRARKQWRVWILAESPGHGQEATLDLMKGKAVPSCPALCPHLSVYGQCLTVLACLGNKVG